MNVKLVHENIEGMIFEFSNSILHRILGIAFLLAAVAFSLSTACATKSDVLILDPGTKTAQTAKDDLWAKAVELASANTAWRPGKEINRIEIQDNEGKTESFTEYTFKIQLNEKGKEVRNLVSAIKDGKEITTDLNKKREEESTKKEDNTIHVRLYLEHPFSSV